jgi:hypothetical protein
VRSEEATPPKCILVRNHSAPTRANLPRHVANDKLPVGLTARAERCPVFKTLWDAPRGAIIQTRAVREDILRLRLTRNSPSLLMECLL